MRFSEQDKGKIAALVDQGWGARRIARHYKWKKSSVQHYVSEYKSTGKFVRKTHNSGRKRKTSAKTDRFIARSVKGTAEKRRKSSREIQNELQAGGVIISQSTIKRRLIEQGLRAHIPTKKPLLRKVNILKRLQWAKKYANWTASDWQKVLWSDESPFELIGGKKRQLVRRKSDEKYHPDCVRKTVKFGGGKLMLWGCFHSEGTGPLFRIQGTMDQKVYKNILVQKARPYLKSSNLTVFQHDNDPKHKAKSVQQYLNGKRFPANVLDWPSQSPDLNPIENLWCYLDSKVRERRIKPKNLDQLYTVLQDEWAKIDPRILRNHVLSMPERCKAVIAAKGLYTKF